MRVRLSAGYRTTSTRAAALARAPLDPRVAAFLDAISASDVGPEILRESDDGYNVIVGSLPGKLITFSSYADHPRHLIVVRPGLKSTAAGRYQIIAPTFDSVKHRAGVRDFTPESQDLCAAQLLRDCGAYDLVMHDDVPGAFAAAAPVWASLPGAGYNQHENKLTQCLAWYADARGKYA